MNERAGYLATALRHVRMAVVVILPCALLACWGKDVTFFGTNIPALNVPQKGSLGGRIFGPNNFAISDAVVRLAPGNFSQTSNSTGDFLFENITTGPVNLTVDPLALWNCTPPTGLSVNAGQNTTANIPCAPKPGSVSGIVTVDNVPRAGVIVTLGTSVDTTDVNGAYNFANVATGSQTISVAPPPNTTCAQSPRTITINPAQNTPANFNCTSTPTTGSAQVTVTHNGAPVANADVTIGMTTARTNALGIASFANLLAASYIVAVSSIANWIICPQQQIQVIAAQLTSLAVTCATIAFTIALDPTYRHFIGFSEVCLLLQTSAALAGAAYLIQITGPSVDGTGVHNGTLDQLGRAFIRNRINLFGTYLLLATILGVQQQVNLVVGAGGGTCPAMNPI